MILLAVVTVVIWISVASADNITTVGNVPAAAGTAVSLGELPHAVVVQSLKDGKVQGKCTGSIIHESWVLTAAHCVDDSSNKLYSPENIQVMAGVIDYKERGSTAQVRNGIKLVVHPEYVAKRLAKFDLALLQVQPFVLSDVVKTVKLSGKEWPQDGRMYNRNCISAGWGMLEGRKDTSVLHKQYTVAKHGLKGCNCIPQGYIMKRVVCLKPENKLSVCFGDSGGALLCEGEVVGVSHVIMDKRACSYFRSPDESIRCESPDVFGIYMFTCPFLGWIGQHVPGVPPPPASCPAPPAAPLSHINLVLGLSAFFLVLKSIDRL